MYDSLSKTARMLFCFALLMTICRVQHAQASSPMHTGLFAGAQTAETAYYNPAGMVRFTESQKTVQLITVYSFSEFEVDPSRTSVSGGNPDSDNTPILVPGFFYVRPFKEDWRFGFALNVPSGFGSDYGGNWAGRYYTESYSLFYVGATPSIAYRINDTWSVGGSLNLTYASTETKAKVNNPGPGRSDGQLEFEAGAVGYTGTLSLMYQFSRDTRLGISYTGETQTDIEDTLSLTGLGPVMDATIGNLNGAEIEIENILPQRLQVGLYHRFPSGRYITIDGIWIDFSEFATGDISVENGIIISPEGSYKDIYGITIGAGFPIDSHTTFKLGAMYLTSGIDDDKRSLSLRIDQMWGLGIGVSRQLNASVLDINLNFYHLGDAPVDTGTRNPVRGRVVGKNSSPYALALDIAWHW